MHYTFAVSVQPKDEKDTRSFWFQKGKLTFTPDFNKRVSSHKEFRTITKFVTFLRWLDENHPDTVAKVLEIRPSGRWGYTIPMGKNWKEYVLQVNANKRS